MDQQSDINSAMAQPMDGQDSDLSELESELEEMLKEDEEKAQATKPVAMTKEEEEEVLKCLEALDMDGILNILHWCYF